METKEQTKPTSPIDRQYYNLKTQTEFNPTWEEQGRIDKKRGKSHILQSGTKDQEFFQKGVLSKF